MDTITKKAYAKINLTLDVISKLDNGYHELKMIMQQISMHDTITVSKCSDDGVFLDCNKNITEIKDNIIYKACEIMKQKYKIDEGIHVHLTKNIFLSAGLAGGSTDCATTILCINELFELNAPIEELMEIGGSLGKDVVYCIKGGLCLATGDGTNLEKLNKYKKTYLLVANPNIEVSTKYIFENFEFNKNKGTDYDSMFNAIDSNNVSEICRCFNNMLESVSIAKHSIIKEIKQNMVENGAMGSLMSGSGATVFGFYKSENDAIYAQNKLKEKYPYMLAEVCYTI